MSLLIEALAWIFGGDTASMDSIGVAMAQQIIYTLVSVILAGVIAIPLGWYIGHTGRGREIAVAASGAARAIPSFGLLILLVLLLGVVRKPEAAVITFVVLAIPSVLAGAYTGFEAIDKRVIDAGRAMGMTEWQILWRIEAPLGLPLLVGGIRAATLQVVATVTIAAYIGLGGLGQYIITGLALQQLQVIVGGAILVAALALVLDGLFAVLQHAVVARGVRAGASASASTKKVPRRATARATPPRRTDFA